MDERLNELKQKQRKLLYRFGEWLYRLYQAGDVELSFPAEQYSHHEEEMNKLLKLLDFMEERVRKFENVSASKEAAEDILEEPSEGAAEISQETIPTEDHTICAASEIPEVLSNREQAHDLDQSTVPCLSQSIGEDLSIETKETGIALETPAVESPTERDTPSPIEPQIPRAAPGSFQVILASAQFKSESQQSLFEDNLEMLQIGDDGGRERALKNLAYFSDKETFRKVCFCVMNDPSPAVRVAAMKLISRTRDANNTEIYRLGLQDSDASVRVAAVKALSTHLPGAKETIPLLEPMLRDSDPYVRGIAVTCLGIYGGPQGLEAASQLWNDASSYVRKSLVDMLAVMHTPGAFSVIKRLMDDPDEGVKQAVESALTKAKSSGRQEKGYGKRQKN